MANNALAAVAAAVALGTPLPEAARGAEQVVRLPGVMQSVAAGQNFPVFLDQASSPERLRAALKNARTATDQRVVTVLPENASPSLLSVGTSLGDLVIAPRPGNSTQDQQAATRWVEDRFSGVALALALAEPGDAVLLAGVARSDGQRNEEEGVVRQLLELRLSNTTEPIPTS